MRVPCRPSAYSFKESDCGCVCVCVCVCVCAIQTPHDPHVNKDTFLVLLLGIYTAEAFV